MIVRCLTSNEISQLLAHLGDPSQELDVDLAKIVELARSWEFNMICQSLFVARHLCADITDPEKIDRMYNMEHEMAMQMEEGNSNIVDYLLRHARDASESLDDALIALTEGFWEHNYERALRY